MIKKENWILLYINTGFAWKTHNLKKMLINGMLWKNSQRFFHAHIVCIWNQSFTEHQNSHTEQIVLRLDCDSLAWALEYIGNVATEN